MPTSHGPERLLPENVDPLIAELLLAGTSKAGPRFGLEVEYFPLDGRRRMTIAETAARLELGLDHVGRRSPAMEDGWRLRTGGTVTFEPGGQIEHATAPHATPGAALEEADLVEAALSAALAPSRLAAAGTDQWTRLDGVPQQLPGFRYQAMDRYFQRRGRFGPLMMRHTAGLQINLDLGSEPATMWARASRLSPLLTTSFACSPAPDRASLRAHIWQQLDATRTGFPKGPGGLVGAWSRFAMDADVMLIRNDQGAIPGWPGFSFRHWVTQYHPIVGWPTRDDLAYHLTTLFPEVRVRRGTIELRALDALPTRWRWAAVVLVVGALYEPSHGIAGRLEALAGQEQVVWERAARHGPRHPELGTLAEAVWSHALDAAFQLPAGWFKPHHLEAAAAYVSEYVLARRTPGDDLPTDPLSNQPLMEVLP
jgi:glutamate--cysteine ligase